MALVLRLWGIGWGLPNALHYFSYHPDETVMMFHSTTLLDPQGLNVFGGSILPHFYNYGSLQLYIVNIALGLAGAYGFLGGGNTAGVFPYAMLAHAYLVGRVVTALMGVGTVWALYALGARLYGRSAGLIGAALLAVLPLHAQHSHFLTVDVPATLWGTLALYWAARAMEPTSTLKGPTWLPLALAGAFSGLAAATKYNMALVFLAVALPVFLRTPTLNPLPMREGAPVSSPPIREGWGGHLGGFAVALAAFFLAFFVACPGSILESGRFIADVRFEAAHVSRQGELWFQETGSGWVYVIARNLDAGMGLPLLVASLAAVGYAVYRRAPGDALLGVYALPYYLVVGAAQSRYARYEIPLLPVLALWTGRMIADGLNERRWRIFGTSIGLALAVFTAIDCLALLRPMTQTDPRDRAAIYLQSNAPSPTPIGLAIPPWFWTPPLIPYFSLPGPTQWMSTKAGKALAGHMLYNDEKPFDATLLAASRPPFVVLSEYEYYDRLRLNQSDAKNYIASLRRDYRPPVVFASTHPLGGIKTSDGLPVQDLPHDMLYTSPTVLVYQRR